MSALALIGELFDAGSFVEWSSTDLGIAIPHEVDPDYRRALEAARSDSGAAESVLVGEARLAGSRVCVIFGEFNFLAGSVGRHACKLLIAAVRRAQSERIPVVAAPCSGGTRMQEGSPSFVLMADVAKAVASFRASGLVWMSWLRHPTTGGVMATWGSLGTVTFAEPGALVGFLGPRVFESLTGQPFPPDVQVAENLADSGVIDGVATLAEFADISRRILAAITPREPISQTPAYDSGAQEISRSVAVQAADATDRPASSDLLELLPVSVRLSGTGAGERSDAVTVHLASWSGVPVVVAAQDRNAPDPLGPAALRFAQRGLRLAEQLRLPLVTIVDTAGAELSRSAEEGALAGEIARSLAGLTSSSVPVVSVLLGRGCGGGALALLAGDEVIAASDSWLAPLPLAGAAIIRYRTVEATDQMADSLRIGAFDLKRSGFVTAVGPPATAPTFPADLVEMVSASLHALTALSAEDLAVRRSNRYSAGI